MTERAPSFDPPPPAGRLRGRKVVLTGAASGIGARIATLFAAEGAALALLDRSAHALREVAAVTGAAALPLDITDEAELGAALAQAAAGMGGIDAVVNCAGLFRIGGLAELPPEEWRRVVEVNLFGPYLVLRASLPWLREAPFATVVNVASALGLVPAGPPASAYIASKGGLISLGRALARELAPRIRVNTLCPGMVETPMTEGVAGDGSHYALKRNVTVQEVAQAALFLTGIESAMMTGVAMVVDGGRTFH